MSAWYLMAIGKKNVRKGIERKEKKKKHSYVNISVCGCMNLICYLQF